MRIYLKKKALILSFPSVYVRELVCLFYFILLLVSYYRFALFIYVLICSAIIKKVNIIDIIYLFVLNSCLDR